MRIIKKFKKGAASFYVVAFSTLILIIIAASFATLIVSEVTRTSNDDLAQSAFDSALAGVEDAKLAFYNYQNCKSQGATAMPPVAGDSSLSCENIVWFVEKAALADEDTGETYQDFLGRKCDMVANILGREKSADGGVLIRETNIDNNMQQFYTCVMIETSLKDYRASLSSANPVRVVKASFDGVAAKKIKKVVLKWHSSSDNAESTNSSSLEFNFGNYDSSNKQVSFPSEGSLGVAVPPTISVGLIQTSSGFTLEDFDVTKDGQTNRGMIYLVPAGDDDMVAKENVQKVAYNKEENKNIIGKEGFLASNDKVSDNLPYLVRCSNGYSANEFACEATVEIPEPIGGDRNDDTFYFIVGLPYGRPATSFAMEFFCEDECYTDSIVISGADGDAVNDESQTNHVNLKGVQVSIDSTGRANNLYRRVETRLEAADNYTLSMMGPIELTGNGAAGKPALEKNFSVSCEANFYSPYNGPNCKQSD